MNVLYVGNKLSVHGSALTGIEILGPLLDARGYEMRFASARKNKAARLADMLLAVFRARRWAHFVLIDTYSTSNFFYALAVAKMCQTLNIPYIPILHGGNLPSRLKNSPALSRAIFGKAKINVAPSGYLQKAFADAGYKVKVIPNPVNLENFNFLGRPVAKPNLLWVRGLNAMSDPAMAVRVAALVGHEVSGVTLTMVGPDPINMQRDLMQLADELGVSVTFKGRLSQTQWAGLSAPCDIFLNTSRVDNAPYSLIEAMSLGLFVVSTRVGGVPHLVNDGKDALLVPHGDDRAMAQAVLRILTDEGLRATMQKAAFENSRRFQKEVIMPLWDDILRGPL